MVNVESIIKAHDQTFKTIEKKMRVVLIALVTSNMFLKEVTADQKK